MVRVQWWVQMKKMSILDEQNLYKDWWHGKWKYRLVGVEQIFCFFFFEKVEQIEIKLLFLIVAHFKLKWILKLLMHWVKYVDNVNKTLVISQCFFYHSIHFTFVVIFWMHFWSLLCCFI
jgi:hypothetical protein